MSSSSGSATGVKTAQIRDASDVTLQLKRKTTQQNYTNDNGAVRDPWNYGNESQVSFLFGKMECVGCAAGTQPFTWRSTRLFR